MELISLTTHPAILPDIFCVWTIYISFERARRAASKDTKISPWSQVWTETNGLKMVRANLVQNPAFRE